MAGPVLRDAARTTAVSRFLAQTAARAGARDPVVLPMPADPDRFPEPGPGGGGIVTVGRLTRQKRMDLLVEAVAVLRARGQAVPLTIVGDGPERAALETLAARRRLTDRVRFAGAVPPTDVPRFLQSADVFAFAARHEGFGLAAAEALIAGVPLMVMADGGGVLDIARAEEGAEIVPAAEPGLVADAIARLLAAPDARADARRAGRRWRDALRPAAVAERLEQVFAEACRP
jgi:glycosyltransferase involved in cell wall biosynthesis